MDEKVEVNKKMLDELISFVKECAFEGNCFADLIVRKYNIK